MGASVVAVVRSPLLMMAVVVVAVLGTATSGNLGFHCVFGPMVTTTTPEGTPLEFCPTQMEPPVMSKGDYLMARKDGACYECMCEADTGLACCECPRPRRQG